MATVYQPESFYDTTLAAAITAGATTISVTTAPNITSGYLVIEANTSNREIILYTGVSGTTLTGVSRGLAEFGSDNSAGTGKAHTAGTDIAGRDVHYYYAQYYDFLTGVSATGSNDMIIGDGNTISADNRFWRVNTSSLSGFWGLSSSGQMVVSEDGSTSYVISAGGSGVTAGDGIDITAGVVSIDRLSTGGLAVSGDALAVGVSSLMARASNTIRVDTTSAMGWSGLQTFTNATATALSATSVKVSAYDVDYLLLNGGNADTLHTHSLGGDKLSLSTTAITVANTTDETSLGSFTLAANTLGTANGVKIYIPLDEVKADNANNYTFALKYGSTTVCSAVMVANATTTASSGYLECYLFATGATNTQKGILNLMVSDTNTFSNSNASGNAFDQGTATEDSTGALTVDVTVDMNVADTTTQVITEGFLATLIK